MKLFKLFLHVINETACTVPETDVVLECKLDPINNLWDFRNHSKNGHPYEILKKEKKILKQLKETIKYKLVLLRCTSRPERCSVGLVWAECARWRDQRRPT